MENTKIKLACDYMIGSFNEVIQDVPLFCDKIIVIDVLNAMIEGFFKMSNLTDSDKKAILLLQAHVEKTLSELKR